jgi:hypothetical protein
MRRFTSAFTIMARDCVWNRNPVSHSIWMRCTAASNKEANSCLCDKELSAKAMFLADMYGIPTSATPTNSANTWSKRAANSGFPRV